MLPARPYSRRVLVNPLTHRIRQQKGLARAGAALAATCAGLTILFSAVAHSSSFKVTAISMTLVILSAAVKWWQAR